MPMAQIHAGRTLGAAGIAGRGGAIDDAGVRPL
jgi:hypothetical protein